MQYNLTPKERIKGLILPGRMNLDLAYFCGVLAGDGSISYRQNKKEYCIKCLGNPADETEYYNNLLLPMIKKLFNLNVKAKFHDNKTTYGFSLYSKNVVKYFTEYIGLPLGKKYDTLKIPKGFLRDKNLVRNFISGLADTDFHLAIKRKNYPVISGVSKSESFIKEIKEFLDNDGFKVCMYKRSYYDKRLFKTIVTYSIELSGYSQFLRWIERINFRHSKNKNKIDFLLNFFKKKNSGSGTFKSLEILNPF